MNKTMAAVAEATREALLEGGKGRWLGLYAVTKDADDGTVRVMYRGTACVTISPKLDKIMLENDGWRTMTTLKVINAALWGVAQIGRFRSYAAYQKSFEWYVSIAPNVADVEFERGMVLPLRKESQ